MINTVFTEYQSQPWIMEPGALKAFAEQLGSMPVNAALFGIQVAKKPLELVVDGGIAKVPIKGYLLDKVPGWLRAWGIEATGYDEIVEQVNSAVEREDVTAIELVVDSPGGMVAGVISAADAIYNARGSKPVNAIINNLSASGAYWLSSQAQKITAADANTLAGSIGVYTWYVDWSKADEKVGIKVIVIRSGEHKGMGLDEITEKQLAAVQEYIDATAGNFINNVARGRGAETEKIAELATGQLWIAARAEELGLIDSVNRSVNVEVKAVDAESVAEALENNSSEIKEQIMETKEEKTEVNVELLRKDSADQATESERKRIAELNEEFVDDPGFAMKAASEGWTVEQALAKYAAVLREKLKAKDSNQSSTNNNQSQSQGSAAVETDDTDGDSDGDFMAEARAMSAEKKITVTAAMKKLARQKPGLHEAFLAQCRTDGKAMYAEAG